ncbi:MAG: hypothetical protein A2849_03880 [Candidatus Taylorbacteria bacterium RIFCSPHIGHO2_01_FULL_51_15]|uniref:Uncharacterized protein n=1 Tax=Candidatus Taylorbacteria bacterium RIFCSPHIGHO2_01_FULL_51_15 TaxID=1802304 RepID=A0A1G2MC78_9BACT|nr:MAG: hypothetical protein A2849_03880 [Candidatus Taylorbacteria bacterium RIFCSPHIGHO2_01_FULL_51_15]
MTKAEGSGFELPEKPPTFDLSDESPDPEDVVLPSSGQHIDSAAKEREKSPTVHPTGEGVLPKAVEKKPEEKILPVSQKNVPERTRTSAEEKARAFNDYFKPVKTGTQLIDLIVDMPYSSKLQEIMSVRQLETFAGQFHKKVLAFFRDFEEGKEAKTMEELEKAGEDFISSEKIPSGCRTAIRAIVNADIQKKLQPKAEALAPEAAREVKTEGSASEKPKPLSAAQIVENYRKRKEAEKKEKA